MDRTAQQVSATRQAADDERGRRREAFDDGGPHSDSCEHRFRITIPKIYVPLISST